MELKVLDLISSSAAWLFMELLKEWGWPTDFVTYSVRAVEHQAKGNAQIYGNLFSFIQQPSTTLVTTVTVSCATIDQSILKYDDATKVFVNISRGSTWVCSTV